MDPERLYNVSPLDGWEDSLYRAFEPDNRTAIMILTDYLGWIPKGYRPKSPRGLKG